MHLQENTFFDLDLGVKFIQNVASCTYLGTKFEVAKAPFTCTHLLT